MAVDKDLASPESTPWNNPVKGGGGGGATTALTPPIHWPTNSNSSATYDGDPPHEPSSFPAEEEEDEAGVYSATHVAVSSAVVTVIMAVIVTGNVLVIVSVAFDRRLRGTQNWFIASLAVSDLLVGLFIMPLSLANELMGHWAFGQVLCQLWLSTDVLLCTASILNLVLISLDRYWTITRSVSYVRTRTRRRAGAMIGVVWALAMVVCFPPLVGWSRPQPRGRAGLPLCLLSEEPGYVVYSTVGSFYLPLVVMVIVYFKIYLVAKRHARRHRKKYGVIGQRSNVDGGGGGGGQSLFSAASNYKDPAMSQTHYDNDDCDGVSSVSQDPDISSDVSSWRPPEEELNAEEAMESLQGSTKGSNGHLNAGSEYLNLAETKADSVTTTTTECQGNNTPTRHLLPTVNRQQSDCHHHHHHHDGGGVFVQSRDRRRSSRGSRRTRAKSLPAAPGSAPNDADAEDAGAGAKGRRRLWQTLSHRRPPSSFGRRSQLNDTTTKIPIIKISHSEANDLDGVLDPPAAPAPVPPPPPPPSGPVVISDQQRVRRRAARLKERRATLILGVVVASFVGCWLPFFSLYPISLLVGFEVPAALFAFIFWLGYINSALNPIIYTIFNREFRLAFKRLLCGRRKTKTQSK